MSLCHMKAELISIVSRSYDYVILALILEDMAQEEALEAELL